MVNLAIVTLGKRQGGCQNQMLPPTTNLDEPDAECILDYVANKAVPHSFDVALSNSFGFGGINATLIMRRWTE